MKKTDRFYLDCPYNDKDECKNQGAYWDADRRKWYVPEGLEVNDFKKWWPGANSEDREQVMNDDGERFYLNVDFSEKDQAKARGARWDPETKKWYVPTSSNKNKFKNWWPFEGDTD